MNSGSCFQVFFLTYFSLELTGEGITRGLSAFKDTWNQFDLVLVVTGIIGVAFQGFNVSVLRLVRLMRLARVVRLFRSLKPLFLLLQGMIAAVSMVFWFGILTLITLYVAE